MRAQIGPNINPWRVIKTAFTVGVIVGALVVGAIWYYFPN